MEDVIYWIWLSILDLRPIEKIKLIKIFKEPSEIFKLNEKDVRNITNNDELIKILKSPGKIKEAINIFQNSKENKTSIICCTNKKYPSRLLQTYDYPIVLYAKGNIELLSSNKTIAIVGSRECTEYGRRITERLSFLISKQDYTVVSGLARGIDAIAHKGTLAANGKTIAVLGCGINFIYPMENEKLYYDILNNNGLIISEYPVKTRPNELYFPMRNRIIAGLSDKVLITEARQKSGSIITANIALEQGKNIYAVPGNITSKQSQGANDLIKDGAILVSTLEDVIEI